MSAPYAAAAVAYLDRGWSPLPLPPGRKFPPPSGFTGAAGMDPSRADVGGWIAEGEYATGEGSLTVGNVALRLPAGVLGIDVDHYGAKTGADTIAEAETTLGPLPPTWRATSRPDTPSGIRLYRVPEGLAWRDLPSVEAIHRGHRYAVVAPSIHPEGRGYVWVDPAGNVHTDADSAPRPEDLPALPAAWVEHLSRPASTSGTADPVEADAVAVAIAAMPTGEPCRCVQLAAGKVLVTGAGVHPGYLPAVLAVLRQGRSGCPGAAATLQRMRAAFIAEATTAEHPRTPQVAAGEWRRMLLGAGVAEVLADPQGTACLNDPAAYGLEPAPADDPAAQTAQERRVRVLRAADDIRIREEARALVARERAAEAYDPPPVVSLPALIADTEAETVRWRWRDFAEIGDRLLIEAGSKVGKTTLFANLVRSALDGSPLLGHFATTALEPSEVLLYLDTELGPRRLSRWLADVLTPAQRSRVLVWSITGRAGGLDVRDDDTRARMVDQVRTALDGRRVGFAIIDVASAWTSALGIDENRPAEVRGWLEAVHAFALDLDADGVAVAHHTGHGAERSRGASSFRDWPDVYATLTRGTTEEDRNTRYLSAVGRDVDIPETALRFDPTTRRLTLAGALGLSRANAARQRIAAGYLDAVVSVAAETPGLTTRRLRAAVAESLRGDGVSVKAAAVGEAVAQAARDGLIRNDGTGSKSAWHPIIGAENVTGHGGDTVGAEVTPRVLPVSLPVSPTVSPPSGTHPVCRVPAPICIGADTHNTHDDEEEAPSGSAIELPWEEVAP